MLTVTDLFCGGGGSSTGMTAIPGVRIRMAANHWKLAVDVHNSNHPDADHAAVDLHEVAAGMAFPADYKWAGTRRERVRLVGNAVTPPAARDLIAAVAEALTGEPVE